MRLYVIKQYYKYNSSCILTSRCYFMRKLFYGASLLTLRHSCTRNAQGSSRHGGQSPSEENLSHPNTEESYRNSNGDGRVPEILPWRKTRWRPVQSKLAHWHSSTLS